MREFLYGRNAVRETLRSARRHLFALQIAESVKDAPRIREITELAASRKLPVKRTPRISLPGGEVLHQGVVLEVSQYPYCDLLDVLDRARERSEPPFVLLLDALQDPQNFGSLLRSAEAVGVHGAVIPLARSVQVTPAVVHASAGASEHLLIARSNLSQALEALKKEDVWIVGLDQHGEPYAAESERLLRGALALAVGSEGEGLHDLTRKKCDRLLQLPMHGNIESLNVSAAGSVALYLACLARQQAEKRT